MILEVALSVLLVSLYLFLYAIHGMRTRKRLNRPPGCYEFPFVGGAIQLVYTAGLRGQHFEKFHRVAKKYGSTIAGTAGALRAAYTEDYETIREVFNSPDWSSRFPSHSRFKEHLLYKNLGLMWSDSDAHREIRKFTFRTFRSIGFGELKKAEIFLQEELGEFIEKLKLQSEKSCEISMQHLFKIPTFNILWRVIAGDRFDYDDPRIHKLINAIDDISQINIGLDPEWSFPFLRYIPGCSPSRAKKPSFIICHQFFIDIMNERRKSGEYREVQNDFIDHLLLKIDEEKKHNPEIYCDEQFHVTCVDLLFGGLDTVANSLEFGILYMILNPEVQVKVQKEIDDIVGSNRLPSVTDRANLRYTEATMLETLRWGNIVPLNGRTSSCDTHLGKYNVEKDTMCAMNTTVVHMSEKLWGDPKSFRPERFLDETGQNIINSEKVLAFGGGTRHCPGYTIAKVIWMAFFTTALQHFKFHPSPIHPQLSTQPTFGVTNTPLPFYAQLCCRN